MARSSFPGISSKLPADVRQFLDRVREFITSTATGFVSRDDLINSGLATVDNRGNLIPGAVGESSRLPPPAPTNVAATGAMTNILVEWDAPIYSNHAYAEVWASGTNDLGVAVRIGTTAASIFAHSVGPSTTRYYWVRFVSQADIEGPYNAVAGTLGMTSDDPAWLLSVLASQLSTDQLTVALNARLNFIEDHQSSIYRLKKNIETAAEAALNAALKAGAIDKTMTDAGIVVNPDTGQVYIYGLEEYKGATDARLSSAELRIDGAEASIALKASVTYVNQAIAEAVIDPSQIANLTDLHVRMSSAEVGIDGLQASILLKADQTVVDGINGRLTTAEGTLTVMAGQISAKAETSTIDNIDARLNTAEVQLATLDSAEIAQQVTSARALRAAQDEQAEGLLNSLLFSNREIMEASGALAFAKQELRAYTDENLEAEASLRTQLATVVGGHTSSIEQAIQSINGIEAAYWIKIDNNGNVTGFGLASELIEGGGATSKFIASVDQFAIVAPDSSLPMWAMGTAYVAGKCVKVSGDTSGKMLVCKAAGTSALSATPPSTSGAIGSLVVDGTVTWQIASKVPFYVLTSAQTINGVSCPPGVYIDGALLVNASVNRAQIAESAVDSLRIADLAVVTAKIANAAITSAKIAEASIDTAHIKAAAITTAAIADAAITNAKIGDAEIGFAKIKNDIQSFNYSYGVSGWRIDRNGAAEFNGGSMTMRSASSGARLEIVGDCLRVYDSSGRLRVKLGNLAA